MDSLLFPIMWVISWIMYGCHSLLVALGLPSGASIAWVLSIVGLTIVVRILIIPLFNKQVRSMRVQQALAPELKKIQAKYKGRTDQISRQRQQEEIMAIYRENGTSPMASCFPMLAQMPIFFSLFWVLGAVLPLSQGTYQWPNIGPITKEVAMEIGQSTLFNAPLVSSISTSGSFAHSSNIIVSAVTLIILLMATMFFTQKQLMMKNMPEEAKDPNSPMYRTQKFMLYGMPLIYVFTGAAFQIGVLIYWVVGNFWTIGQQTWMIMKHPAPGSDAYRARQERLRKARAKKGLSEEEEHDVLADGPRGQREQPLGKARSKKAAAKAEVSSAVENELLNEEPEAEVRGLDGLTNAERAQKRYERRMAQRQRTQQKKQNRGNKR